MKFFLAAASTAFVVLLPSFVTANPFSITAPTTTAADFTDATPGGSNDLDPFVVDYAGYVPASFTVSYSACDTPATGSFSESGGIVTLTNPSPVFTGETWCVKVELSLTSSVSVNPDGNDILAAIEYTVTVTIQPDGSFLVDDSHVDLQLPATASFTDADGLGEIAYDPFADMTYVPLAEVDPDPIVMGVTSTAQVDVNLDGADVAGYSCSVVQADILTASLGVVPGTPNGGVGASADCGYQLTGITNPANYPASFWAGQDAFIVQLTVNWYLSRRLEDGTIQQELASSGTVEIEVEAKILMQKEELSTAAIAGIAAGAGIIFFLVVFTMWRQGCFEDKRAAAAAAKPPKTVCVDEENSATTGSDVQA